MAAWPMRYLAASPSMRPPVLPPPVARFPPRGLAPPQLLRPCPKSRHCSPADRQLAHLLPSAMLACAICSGRNSMTILAMTRRAALAATAAAVLCAGAAPAALSQSKELRVLNWQGYGTDEKWALEQFQQ